MGSTMQSQAHGGCRKGRRAWGTGCRRAALERSTQEEASHGQAKRRHGEGEEQGDTEGQQVAGTMPAEEEGQHGRRGRLDDSQGHGPPEGGPGTRSVAAEAGTVGYGNADRSGRSRRGARRRPVVPASVKHGVSGATVEKSVSAPGIGATEAYSDTTGEERRVQRWKEHRGSQHSSGYGALMEGRRTAGVRRRTGGAKSDVCSVTRESDYETWRRCTRPVEVGVSIPPGRC